MLGPERADPAASGTALRVVDTPPSPPPALSRRVEAGWRGARRARGCASFSTVTRACARRWRTAWRWGRRC
jgi:hypothetical protein